MTQLHFTLNTEDIQKCDRPTWHKLKRLKIPENIEIKHIPPYPPEMNPIIR